MTTTFLAPPENFAGPTVRLPEDEAHHASRVVRHQAGDVIRVVDGRGTAFQVQLTTVERGDVRGEVIRTIQGENEPPYHLTLAVGMLKKRDRFETMVEKAVELGVSRIVPIQSSRTEKTGFRIDRLEKIAVAALKQSGRSRLTEIAEPVLFGEYLSTSPNGLRMICHEQAVDGPSITELLTSSMASTIEVLIGPEGGFDDEEVAHASSAGFEVVHLGARRLRAETAAIYAAAACTMISDNTSIKS